MDNFEYCKPTHVYFGRGVENSVGTYVKAAGGSRVLLVSGQGSAERSGLLQRVRTSLMREGLSFFELKGVKPNPRADLVYAGIETARSQGVDLILGVGGGSVIDTAKAVANGVPYAGDFFDFHLKKAKPEQSLPVGCVLTLTAAGSEGSDSCVIEKEVDGKVIKSGHNCPQNVPAFAVLNPELTFTLPPYQSACGITDMMAHVMERYFTNTRGVSLTDRLCEAVLLSIVENGRQVMADPYDYDAQANLMWAGTLAHNNSCGVGREQDWASHHLEHQLSALYDVAHGAGLAVIFPAWMEYNLNHDVMRFAQFATRVFGCEMDFEEPERTARAGIAALRSFYKEIGMPLSFDEIGAKEEDIPRLLNVLGVDEKDRLEGHFVSLKRSDCEQIYLLAARYGRKPR